jgi:hypothetical protein
LAESIQALVRDLRGFVRRKEVIKELRVGIRQPVPTVRKAIKANAIATLPAGGGLNRWVASTRVTAQIKITSYSARVRLRGGRNSARKRSDIDAIDRGRVRHPSWGRRGPGQWHSQAVSARFFTEPAASAPQWMPAIDDAVARAFDTLRRG